MTKTSCRDKGQACRNHCRDGKIESENQSGAYRKGRRRCSARCQRPGYPHGVKALMEGVRQRVVNAEQVEVYRKNPSGFRERNFRERKILVFHPRIRDDCSDWKSVRGCMRRFGSRSVVKDIPVLAKVFYGVFHVSTMFVQFPFLKPSCGKLAFIVSVWI